MYKDTKDKNVDVEGTKNKEDKHKKDTECGGHEEGEDKEEE